MSTQLLDGEISIYRGSGTAADHVSIRLADKTSGIVILEAEVGFAEFAKAISGCADQDCRMKYNPSENVGRERESRQIVVADARSERTRLRNCRAAIEDDGRGAWNFCLADFNNQHRRVKGGVCVTAHRWVKDKVK